MWGGDDGRARWRRHYAAPPYHTPPHYIPRIDRPVRKYTQASLCLCCCCQSLEVSHALLERGCLLGRRDGGLDAVHNPVHHVLLFQASLDIGDLKLVVQTLLHLKHTKGCILDIFVQKATCTHTKQCILNIVVQKILLFYVNRR